MKYCDDLLNTLKDILAKATYSDGLATINTLDVELLERRIHACDPDYLPSRPDFMVDPCVHDDCTHCRGSKC